MSRNSSGTYTQPNGTAAVSGATIDPTAFNTLISDLGNEVTNSLDRGGRGAMTAALNAGGFKVTNAADPASAQDLATKNYVDTATAGAVTDGSITTAKLADGAGTPAKLSTGHPTWDTSGNLTAGGNLIAAGSVTDGKGDARDIPMNAKTTSYTLVASDAGKCIPITTGGVTIPNSVFAASKAISIINDSGTAQTITQGSGVTMYQAGTTNTGNRTIAARGIATVVFTGASTAYISGNVS